MTAKRSIVSAMAGLAVLALLGCDKPGVNPKSRHNAMARGVTYLQERQQADGAWEPHHPSFPGGSTALASWALLEADQAGSQRAIGKALAWLADLKTDRTYTLAIRANVWQRAAEDNEQYTSKLQADVQRLIRGAADGAYSYTADPKMVGMGDQSNSHYGVMGVEAGVRGNIEVPAEYWRNVANYWRNMQNRDGGWPYSLPGNPSTATMTAAGVATLALCDQQLAQSTDRSVQQGMDWLSEHFLVSLRDPHRTYYYFLALQRMARLADRDALADRNVETTIVAELIRLQKPDGSWNGPWGTEIATAYAVIVLANSPAE